MSTPGKKQSEVGLYGLLGEFDSPEVLLHAAAAARQAGYTELDAYAPFPLEGLDDAIGFRSSKVQLLALMAGCIGGLSGYGLQYWVNVYAYPINIGGRPLNSIPSFIPVTFELTILFASLTAVFSMLVLNGLPQLYHPVFNVPAFAARGSRDRFFLCIEQADPAFHYDAIRTFMKNQGAVEVHDVAP